MKAGAVGALEGCKTPSKVARLVMERTDRVFLVGEGARKFATRARLPRRGSPDAEDEEDLALLERAHVRHRRLGALGEGSRGPGREVVPREVRQRDLPAAGHDPHVREEREGRPRRRHDDVRPLLQDPRARRRLAGRRRGHLLARTASAAAGPRGAARRTSSPAARTPSSSSCGRGRARRRRASSRSSASTRRPTRSPATATTKGRPKFNVSFYAVDAKGSTAGAAIWSGSKYVVGDNDGVRTLESAYLYKKEADARTSGPRASPAGCYQRRTRPVSTWTNASA